MGEPNNTIKTRIQLKSDTEENWNKLGPKDGNRGFIPKDGELIIYSADGSHPFSRLKVGDGSTNIVSLPFIDAGTLNGKEATIIKKAAYSEFPSPGLSTYLYLDESTSRVYHYDSNAGYTPILNFHPITINSYSNWRAGDVSRASIKNNIFKFETGIKPNLDEGFVTILSSITEEEYT